MKILLLTLTSKAQGIPRPHNPHPTAGLSTPHRDHRPLKEKGVFTPPLCCGPLRTIAETPPGSGPVSFPEPLLPPYRLDSVNRYLLVPRGRTELHTDRFAFVINHVIFRWLPFTFFSPKTVAANMLLVPAHPLNVANPGPENVARRLPDNRVLLRSFRAAERPVITAVSIPVLLFIQGSL